MDYMTNDFSRVFNNLWAILETHSEDQWRTTGIALVKTTALESCRFSRQNALNVAIFYRLGFYRFSRQNALNAVKAVSHHLA